VLRATLSGPNPNPMPIPDIRLRAVNGVPVREAGEFVLYWMIAARRTTCSYALEHALERSRELGRPLVVLEALRTGYPWASDRHHRFAIDAMRDNAARFSHAGITHHPYVEPEAGAGRGLLESLAARACLVVTDEFPEFFLPRMVEAAGRKLDVRLEQVDGNGLIPLRAAPRAFTHAHVFRRWLQGEIHRHLARPPLADPLAGPAPPPLPALALDGILRRWPPADAALLAGDPGTLDRLPIDHTVPPAPLPGGAIAAGDALRRFLGERLPRYAADRNRLDDPVVSGLSPYLHWGCISAHEVFDRLAEYEGWSRPEIPPAPTGARSGWWRMGESAEAFLDQLVTWRELSLNTSFRMPDHWEYASLPDWARATLDEHRGDPRPRLFSLEELEQGATYDPLWNAAQGELLRDGRIHNSLRMLWGKRILEWTADPEQAWDWMVHLNNRLALDGRDPNSWSGISWCFGRYDRAWGPERAVYGKVRYLSSKNTARKLRLGDYVERFTPPVAAAG
jgi:deoxyribodipyrimidine photo-lyase